MKKVVLLGSTGSIGTSTIKVAEDLPQHIQIVGLAAGNNADLLLEQTKKFSPLAISITDPAKARWDLIGLIVFRVSQCTEQGLIQNGVDRFFVVRATFC